MTFNLCLNTAQPSAPSVSNRVEPHAAQTGKFLIVASSKAGDTPIQCCQIVEAVDALEAVQLYSASAAHALQIAARGARLDRRNTNIHAIAVPADLACGPVSKYMDVIETLCDSDGAISNAVRKSAALSKQEAV